MKKIPTVCNTCGSKNPGMQLQFVSSLAENCIICGATLEPVATIHLAVPCEKHEAHPIIKPKMDGNKLVFQKLSCGSTDTPKYLTALPEAATCYDCVANHSQSKVT